MQKLTHILFALFLTLSLGACDSQETASATQSEIAANKIYFFYQTNCPHCHHALAYIKQKHPDLAMEMQNIAEEKGYRLFTKCAAKFHLGQQIGTPLFCMGNNYLMGWSPEYEKQFDIYAQPFLKE